MSDAVICVSSLLARIEYIGPVDSATGKAELRFFIDDIEKMVTSVLLVSVRSLMSVLLDFLFSSARDAVLCSAALVLVVGVAYVHPSPVRFEMPSVGLRRYHHRHHGAARRLLVHGETQRSTGLQAAVAQQGSREPVHQRRHLIVQQTA